MTRRTLLLAGAGATAAAAIPDLAVAAKSKVLRRSHLDRSTWQPFVGSTLWVRDRGTTPVPVTLLRVTDVGVQMRQTAKFREKTFVLHFRGAADSPLAVDTHLIRLKGIGKVPVWFSSASLTEFGWEYVAVFANGKLKAPRPRKPGGRRKRRRKAPAAG